MSIEQRLEQVERQTKRLLMAVVVLAASLCGMVSCTEKNVGYFDMVIAKSIFVTNDKNVTVISLMSDKQGNGEVTVLDRQMKGRVYRSQ